MHNANAGSGNTSKEEAILPAAVRIKLNSYSNASGFFLSLCRMHISLFRMCILVCKVEKMDARKRWKNACVSMNSA